MNSEKEKSRRCKRCWKRITDSSFSFNVILKKVSQSFGIPSLNTLEMDKTQRKKHESKESILIVYDRSRISMPIRQSCLLQQIHFFFYTYSRCERLRLTSCFHFSSHQSGTDSPLMVRIGWRFSLVIMRSSAFSSVKFRLYIPEYAVAVPRTISWSLCI